MLGYDLALFLLRASRLRVREAWRCVRRAREALG